MSSGRSPQCEINRTVGQYLSIVATQQHAGSAMQSSLCPRYLPSRPACNYVETVGCRITEGNGSDIVLPGKSIMTSRLFAIAIAAMFLATSLPAQLTRAMDGGGPARKV